MKIFSHNLCWCLVFILLFLISTLIEACGNNLEKLTPVKPEIFPNFETPPLSKISKNNLEISKFLHPCYFPNYVTNLMVISKFSTRVLEKRVLTAQLLAVLYLDYHVYNINRKEAVWMTILVGERSWPGPISIY